MIADMEIDDFPSHIIKKKNQRTRGRLGTHQDCHWIHYI
ncbi:hypothetical protein Goklo_004830 [Gossypium klotzschianum]|uniref:Uncharacterized protein n=1 Tax=Gossypium klotzschianum TaxID=34286 RepID=A0A7J8VQ21_9ROSI|nr:hypothetical protein [Gossypium klotzschianum]